MLVWVGTEVSGSGLASGLGTLGNPWGGVGDRVSVASAVVAHSVLDAEHGSWCS